MNISIICTSAEHPVNPWLARWAADNAAGHSVSIVRRQDELTGGDLLFIISCSEIITRQTRDTFRKSLVIHASDLPQGRGWSPWVWSILAGRTEVVVTLLEAADEVDAGDIWRKLTVDMPRHMLFDEINSRLFDAELELMSYAVENCASVVPVPQSTAGVSYLKKRQPADSEVDPQQSIEAQFDLLRVCDPDRYPAFFSLHGHTYAIRLEKIDDE